MCTMGACQKVGNGISPFVLVMKTVNVVINKIQNNIDIISAVEFPVHVLHHKLCVGIASTSPHPGHGTVYNDIPQSLAHFDKFLGQGEGHLQIVVGVETNPRIGPQIVMYEMKNPLEIFPIHGTKSINNGKSVRFQMIDQINQFQKFGIGIAKYVHRLNIKFVSLFNDASAKRNDIISFLFKKAGPHAVNGTAIIRFQVVDGIAAIVRQTYIRCLFAVFRKK